MSLLNHFLLPRSLYGNYLLFFHLHLLNSFLFLNNFVLFRIRNFNISCFNFIHQVGLIYFNNRFNGNIYVLSRTKNDKFTVALHCDGCWNFSWHSPCFRHRLYILLNFFLIRYFLFFDRRIIFNLLGHHMLSSLCHIFKVNFINFIRFINGLLINLLNHIIKQLRVLIESIG